MSFVDDLIKRINDQERRLSRIEKLDVAPPSTLSVYSGTPTAGAIAYWTGAGTVAGDRTVYTTSGGGVIIGDGTVVGSANLYLTQDGQSLLRINSGTSNPEIRYMLAGATKISMGVSQADSLFRIVYATSLASTNGLMMTSTGALGIGEDTPGGKLHVEQASTTAAIPTLWLRQADVSEEFIRFEATVSAGNSLNTTALGTYYGRARVYVEGVGEKWIPLYNT